MGLLGIRSGEYLAHTLNSSIYFQLNIEFKNIYLHINFHYNIYNLKGKDLMDIHSECSGHILLFHI